MLEKLQEIVIEENQNLEKLKAFLSQPNYLEILGVSVKELQHSNFLSWMLNAKASHNVGNFFLKSFINLVSIIPPEEKIRINLSDLDNTIIYREFNDIDLLIVDETLNFTICIENKIKSGKSGENQLLKYYEIVENIWSDKKHKNYYIYLTPFPRSLTQEEIDINYQNLTYHSILEILEDTMLSKESEIINKPLIENYISNLKKNIMGISKEAKLAQEIYRKHKAAIEFIIRNKPTLYTKELFNQINKFFQESSNYDNLTPNDKSIIRFLPKEVTPYFNNETNSWRGTTSSFALEVFCEQEKIWVKFCFGAISVKDDQNKAKKQERKDKVFSEMKQFKSISSGLVRRSKSSSNYPSVANFNIVKIGDKSLLENENVYSVFIEKFKAFEDKVLNKWVIEIKEKITRA